jgi:hypothetical protein
MGSDIAAADPVIALADVLETVVKAALAPLVGRIRALEATAAVADIAAVPLRLAALEGGRELAGPPGPPGPPGLGFESYGIEYDGDRTLIHKWARGDQHFEVAIKLPTPIYRGVFVAGKTYERGDCVTADGSLWHCNAETTMIRPGGGAAAWTLAVKRGQNASAPR